MLPKTIVFITGAFVHHSCWDEWRTYFERLGFSTVAPPWPHKDASPESLRNRHPGAEIASNRLGDLIDYFDKQIRQFAEPPVLIGHSIGGLIVQVLLQRGLGFAGVAIHSVPPRGIVTFKLSFLKAGWGPLGFFTNVNRSFLMSFKQWQYAFTNGMDCEEQKQGYYNFVIPESKRVVRDTLSKAAQVDFRKQRAPLLLTSGSEDNTIPASLNLANYKKYGRSSAVTDYKEFSGRNHFVLGQASWREDAEFIVEWLRKQR